MPKKQFRRIIWTLVVGFFLLTVAILANQYKFKTSQNLKSQEKLIISQKPVLISLIRLTPNGEAMFAGFGPIHSQIEIFENNHLIGITTSDKKGQWVMLTEKPLPSGQRQFKTFSIAKNKGDIEAREIAGETLNIFIPDPDIDPEFKTTSDKKSDIIYKHKGLLIDFIGYDLDKNLTIRGISQQDERIEVCLNQLKMKMAKPNKDGNWVATSQTDLKPGTYTIAIKQLSAESKKFIAKTDIVFQVYTNEKNEKQYNFIIVKPGNSLWDIAERSYGLGNDFEKIFEANQENLRSPELIYPGQILYIPRQSNNKK